MGRVAFSFADFYIYDDQQQQSTCRKCSKKLKGKQIANLKRHYKNVHKTDILGGNVFPEKKLVRKSKIGLSKNEFIKCCVGLVTIKSLPFKIFDDKKYFKKILALFEDVHELHLNSKNFRDHVQHCAKEIENWIKNQLSNKMISIKIDIGCRMDKHILGINAQVIIDGKIQVLNLGMIQIKKRHTAQNLKDEVVNCLSVYDVSIHQVYSCTTDNASNVLKMSALLRGLQEESQPNEDFGLMDEEEFDIINNEISSFLSIVRCAAHTIQLVCHDVFKNISDQIEDARKTVKTIRNRIKLNNIEIQMPTLDTPTRWNSTFDMINSLHNLQDVCTDLLENQSDINWFFINKFVKSFNPLSTCTIRAQTESYIIGDFYRDWLCAKLDIEEEFRNGNTFAEQILSSMNIREKKLMGNSAFVAALYLDPRFNFHETPFLSSEQRSKAMNHLINVNKNLYLISKPSSSSQNTQSISLSPDGKLYAKLEQKVIEAVNLESLSIQKTLNEWLHKLSCGDRAPFDSDVLTFWKFNKISSEEMTNLSEIVLAVPPTQVSVERAFSSLSYILTKQRSRLSKENIHNILLVKLNEDVLEQLIPD